MNATLLHTPRALAAAVAALALTLAIALISPTVAEDFGLRLRDRPAASQASSAQPAAVSSASWVRTPLASPLDTLRAAPR